MSTPVNPSRHGPISGGGPNVSLSGGMVIGSTGSSIIASNVASANTVSASANCSAVGHRVAEPVEYIDGAIAGNCDNCGDRVQLDGVKGGDARLRAEELVAVVMALADTEKFDANALLETIASVEDRIDADVKAMVAARSTLHVIRKGLTRLIGSE